MRTISLKIPAAVDDDLQRRATDQGTSKSALIRTAVQRYLERDADDTSVLQRASDLAGCFAGPADLSVDPSHLDGYGA